MCVYQLLSDGPGHERGSSKKINFNALATVFVTLMTLSSIYTLNNLPLHTLPRVQHRQRRRRQGEFSLS